MDNTILLPDAALLEIREGEALYHGGDQEWYPDKWQREAGCGPTNCSNLMWYLAQTRPDCAPLCPYDAWSKAGFLQLMEDMWRYVTPRYTGVSSTTVFADSARRYALDRGVRLTAATLDVAPLGGKRKSKYEKVADYIASALENRRPVAFLNLSNGTLTNLDNWHWVTLAGLRGEEGLIYDQGDARWIALRQWLETSMMGGGFVNLYPEGEPSL